MKHLVNFSMALYWYAGIKFQIILIIHAQVSQTYHI